MNKVSVIIPTYSRPQNLLRSIRSVFSQTYREIEIIVVDDNGQGTQYQLETETALKCYIEEHKLIYIKHQYNKNGSAARNTGLRACTGEYFTFLDDDDYLYPQKIEKQVNALKMNAACGMVYCGYERRSEVEILSKHIPHEYGNLQLEILKKSWGCGSGSNPMFRREVYQKIGGFDESFIRHQDLEYMVRAFRHFEICVVPDILLSKYVDSSTNRPNVERYAHVKEHFLRKFHEDIVKYNIKEQKKVYRNNWYEIALLAISESRMKGLAYLRKSCSYKMLSAKQFVKFTIYMLFSKTYGR